MSELFVHGATVFMGFMAIMNPLANVPIFLGLTKDDDVATTRAIAFRSLALAFVIVALFAATGRIVFDLFGVTLPAFRITGGLLVFNIGFQMLQGSPSKVHHVESAVVLDQRQAALSVAVSPLAMPILAGPGTIATAMSYTADAGIAELVVTLSAFGLLCAITYVLFVFGGKLVDFIGASALGVVTRMMGLILAVIGTQMVIEGIRGAFSLTG